MKTVGKRINPAFTVVQPLPTWPLWPARQFDQNSGDRQAAAPSAAPLVEMAIAVTATTVHKTIPSVAIAN